MWTKLQRGVTRKASVGCLDGPALDSCAVVLSEVQGSFCSWHLDCWAQLEDGTMLSVARIITLQDAKTRGSRLIARLCVPGAKVWHVDGRLERNSGLQKPTEARIALQASQGSSGPAVEVFEGVLVPRDTWGYASGAAPATVQVPAGARVKEVSCSSGPAGATIIVGAGAFGGNIIVPADSGFTLCPDRVLMPLAQCPVAFANDVLAYFVSWEV